MNFMEVMDFESLANELLLDVFEYFSTCDLLWTFSHLNSRFTQLVRCHFETHCFYLHSISKEKFHYICEHRLPSIVDDIMSLRLSDDDDTPQGVDYFFSFGWTLERFSRLQSLIIDQLHSSSNIFEQFSSLSHLTHLFITRYCLQDDPLYNQTIIRAIRHLSHLLSCHVDITYHNDSCSAIVPIVSSRLQTLSLPNLDSHIHQLIGLIEFLSNLQYLHIRLNDDRLNFSLPSIRFQSIRTLKITFYGSVDVLRSLFTMLPNLYRLQIAIDSNLIDGHQWEALIRATLVNLQVFQLKMYTSVSNGKNGEEEIDQLLFPFTSPFWLTEHQWFVQCDWSHEDYSSLAYLYTLPYAFENYIHLAHVRSKSTYPYGNQTWSYDRIYNIYSNQSTFDSPAFCSRNILSLDITMTNDKLFVDPIIVTFDRLHSLHVVLSDFGNQNDIYSKMTFVLRQSVHLHSLTIFSWSIDYLFLLNIEHRSIRRLDFQGPHSIFNQEQCLTLARSNLGQQCEILLIAVKERENVLDLLHSMAHLRTLTVRCPKDKFFFEWLQTRLPSTCTISNSSRKFPYSVRLWVR